MTVSTGTTWNIRCSRSGRPAPGRDRSDLCSSGPPSSVHGLSPPTRYPAAPGVRDLRGHRQETVRRREEPGDLGDAVGRSDRRDWWSWADGGVLACRGQGDRVLVWQLRGLRTTLSDSGLALERAGAAPPALGLVPVVSNQPEALGGDVRATVAHVLERGATTGTACSGDLPASDRGRYDGAVGFQLSGWSAGVMLGPASAGRGWSSG